MSEASATTSVCCLAAVLLVLLSSSLSLPAEHLLSLTGDSAHVEPLATRPPTATAVAQHLFACVNDVCVAAPTVGTGETGYARARELDFKYASLQDCAAACISSQHLATLYPGRQAFSARDQHSAAATASSPAAATGMLLDPPPPSPPLPSPSPSSRSSSSPPPAPLPPPPPPSLSSSLPPHAAKRHASSPPKRVGLGRSTSGLVHVGNASLDDPLVAWLEARHRGPCTWSTPVYFAGVSPNGIGNKLLGMVMALHIALMQGRRLIVTDWPPRTLTTKYPLGQLVHPSSCQALILTILTVTSLTYRTHFTLV